MARAENLRSLGLKPSGHVDLEGSSEEMIEYAPRLHYHLTPLKESRENQLEEGCTNFRSTLNGNTC